MANNPFCHHLVNMNVSKSRGGFEIWLAIYLGFHYCCNAPDVALTPFVIPERHPREAITLPAVMVAGAPLNVIVVCPATGVSILNINKRP